MQTETDGLCIVFTGGGTGGHVQPIVSLIEYGQEDNDIYSKCKQLYWFGESGGLEEQVASGLVGVSFVPLLAGKIRRYWTVQSSLANIVDSIKVFFAFFQSIRHLWRKRVDVVFCKGGYVALPVCRAAWFLRIPVLLHESDLHPGLTNRLVAKIAQTIYTGFPKTFAHEVVVGQIFSDRLASYETVVDTDTHCLVMGGSQGAESLLHLVESWLGQEHGDIVFHIILGTRQQDKRAYFESYENVTCYDYVDQQTLATLYAQSDIALTRAGVTSLAEQALFGIKKIIVPHPWGGGYHQLANALRYAQEYDDIVLEEGEQLEENVHMFFDKLIGWKKHRDGVDATRITQAKKTIWEGILKNI